MEDLLLKPEDVAKVLKIGRTKVYELIHDGSLPSVKKGRSDRMSTEAILLSTSSLQKDSSNCTLK